MDWLQNNLSKLNGTFFELDFMVYQHYKANFHLISTLSIRKMFICLMIAHFATDPKDRIFAVRHNKK